ncbi:MAG: biotin transporter BioY [Hyphomicrobiales bacterium]|nr:biotin transporter BioY [Hyphomicrobiales bacterium]
MKLQDLIHISLFAALTAALGLVPRIDFVAIVPVPITAQSMGPMLAGAILGARRGALSQALFLVLLAAGLPLLSGGRGGFGVFATPSAGFVLAWPLAAAVTGLLVERFWRNLGFFKAYAASVIGGIGVVYLIGIPVLAAIAGLSLSAAIAGSALFIPGDLIKAALAASVAMFVKRGYPIINAAPARV